MYVTMQITFLLANIRLSAYATVVLVKLLSAFYKQAMHQPWSTVDVTRDAQIVKELLRVRNDEIYLRDFTMGEISALIECVCVTTNVMYHVTL